MKDRKPNRLRGYDYSSDNLYFVTSCVQNRVCCFGEIVVGTGRDPSLHDDDKISVGAGRDLHLHPYSPQIILNEFGKIAEKQWHWLSEQYTYVILHAFVVMPNHIHGIIEINRNSAVGSGRNLYQQNADLSVQKPKTKSLSELMGAYKTTVSKEIHLTGFIEFKWQRSFHDQIIRNEKEFETISDYIFRNPLNWEEDKLYNL